MNKLNYLRGFFFLVFFYTCTSSNAAVMSLMAIDQGFVTETGGSSKFDGLISPATYNYSTGWELICPAGGLCSPPFIYGEKKNHFVFDLTTVSETVIGATLFIGIPEGGYDSPDESETFIISGTGVPKSDIDFLSMPTIPSEITASHIGTAATVFASITDEFDIFGSAFASVDIGEDDEGTIIALPLTSMGVEYINVILGGSGDLIFGGKVTTLSKTVGVTEEVFSFSDSLEPTVVLELTTVPIPAAFWLLGSGLLGLFVVSKDKGRRNIEQHQQLTLYPCFLQ